MRKETTQITDTTEGPKATTEEITPANASATNPIIVRMKASARNNKMTQMSTPTTVTGAEKNPNLIETPIRNTSANLNNEPTPVNITLLIRIKRRLPVVPPTPLNCSSSTNILLNESSLPTEITALFINVTQRRKLPSAPTSSEC